MSNWLYEIDVSYPQTKVKLVTTTLKTLTNALITLLNVNPRNIAVVKSYRECIWVFLCSNGKMYHFKVNKRHIAMQEKQLMEIVREIKDIIK